jgi:hypothetical protein
LIVNTEKYGCVFCRHHFERWRDLVSHAGKKHPRKKWVRVTHDGGYRMAASSNQAGRVVAEIESLLLREVLNSR